MKLLILSDSHGSKVNMDKISTLIIEEIDLIIHAGDNFRDSIYLKNSTGKPVIAVSGNCDFDNVETEIEFEIEGIKFFLTHGHRYRVKQGSYFLAEKAKEKGANIAIYGHTHVKESTFELGVHILNPGSLSLPRDGIKGSYIIMDVNDADYHFEFRYL